MLTETIKERKDKIERQSGLSASFIGQSIQHRDAQDTACPKQDLRRSCQTYINTYVSSTAVTRSNITNTQEITSAIPSAFSPCNHPEAYVGIGRFIEDCKRRIKIKFIKLIK